MSQNFDPYQPPSLSNSMPTSPETEDLRNIAFWQNFFSILGFIVTGLTVLAMVGNIVFSAMSPNPIPRVIGATIGSVIGLAMAIAVYVIPSVLLSAAAKASRDFGEHRIALGDYVLRQRKFWRYLGIMTCILMAIYVMLLILFVLLVIIAGVRR